jgi:hypothetical protein
MSTSITLDNEQRRFVVANGGGVSCLGFDVVFAQASELAKRLASRGLQVTAPEKADIGTLGQYRAYQALFAQYRQVHDITTWFDGRTPPAVRAGLEQLRKSRHRARVFYGDTRTGRAWLEENDVIGRIGRSAGPMKVPLLVAKGEEGGMAVLTHCIVRLVDITTGKDLFRHRDFHLGKLVLVDAADYDKPLGYTCAVKSMDEKGELELVANFTTEQEAHRWLAFMAGEIHDLGAQPLARAA